MTFYYRGWLFYFNEFHLFILKIHCVIVTCDPPDIKEHTMKRNRDINVNVAAAVHGRVIDPYIRPSYITCCTVIAEQYVVRTVVEVKGLMDQIRPIAQPIRIKWTNPHSNCAHETLLGCFFYTINGCITVLASLWSSNGHRYALESR